MSSQKNTKAALRDSTMFDTQLIAGCKALGIEVK